MIPPDLAAASRVLAAGDTVRALELTRAYVLRQPKDVGGLLLLIQVHVARNDPDSAYSVAARAVRDHPADLDLLYHLGSVTRQLAGEEFMRLEKTAPHSARMHQLRAEAFEAQDRRADAEAAYAAAIAADPNLVDALLGLARLQRIRLACDDALPLYERAEAIRPSYDGAYGLGICHSYMQHDALAVQRLEQAVARDPSAAVAWSGLGTSLVKLGRTADGIAKLQRAVALAPDMDTAHYMLGVAFQQSGDTTRAQEAFKRAEQLRSGR